MDPHSNEYDAAVSGMTETYGVQADLALAITPDLNRPRGPDRVLLYREGKARSRCVILHAVGTDGLPGRRAWRVFDALEVRHIGPLGLSKDTPLPVSIGPLEKILEMAAAWCRSGRWA